MTAGDRVRGVAAQQLRCHLPSGGKEIPTEETTGVGLSRETGISGNFVGRIKGAKCPFDLQFLTWDFS